MTTAKPEGRSKRYVMTTARPEGRSKRYVMTTAKRAAPLILLRALAAVVVAGALLPLGGSPASASDVTVHFRCKLVTSTPSPTPAATPTPTAGPTSSPEPSPTPEPERECTPTSGQTIHEQWAIVFQVNAGTGRRLANVQLFVLSEDGEIPSPGQEPNGAVMPVRAWAWELPDAPSSVELSYDWDTRTLTPYNGHYTIRVVAHSHAESEAQATTAQRDGIAVDNTPIRPPAPTVTSSEQLVTVQWSVGKEPDAVFFELLRARTSSEESRPSADDFEVLAEALSKTSYVDEPSNPGAYWYRVRLARRSVVADDGVTWSSASATSQSAAMITVAPAPASPSPRPAATPTAGPVKPKPRPVPVVASRPPRPPEAPFSAVLPYGDIPQAQDDPAQDTAGPFDFGGDPDDPAASRTALLPVAIGAFLVSAALSLGRGV